MQWKCLPVPKDPTGKPAIHYTTVYKVFAKWADDGSLWQAFIASVRHLADQKYLDLSVLHGDGTNTVAKKGGMGSKHGHGILYAGGEFSDLVSKRLNKYQKPSIQAFPEEGFIFSNPRGSCHEMSWQVIRESA
jgi:hypothetical protein